MKVVDTQFIEFNGSIFLEELEDGTFSGYPEAAEHIVKTGGTRLAVVEQLMLEYAWVMDMQDYGL